MVWIMYYYQASEWWKSKSSFFRCFPYSGVCYSDPHCIQMSFGLIKFQVSRLSPVIVQLRERAQRPEAHDPHPKQGWPHPGRFGSRVERIFRKKVRKFKRRFFLVLPGVQLTRQFVDENGAKVSETSRPDFDGRRGCKIHLWRVPKNCQSLWKPGWYWPGKNNSSGSWKMETLVQFFGSGTE